MLFLWSLAIFGYPPGKNRSVYENDPGWVSKKRCQFHTNAIEGLSKALVVDVWKHNSQLQGLMFLPLSSVDARSDVLCRRCTCNGSNKNARYGVGMCAIHLGQRRGPQSSVHIFVSELYTSIFLWVERKKVVHIFVYQWELQVYIYYFFFIYCTLHTCIFTYWYIYIYLW